MTKQIHCTSHTEGGNSVTLTLLGLAVAVLAGVVMLYFLGKSTPQPIPNPVLEERNTTFEPENEIKDPRAGWRTYENEEYDFLIQYPPGFAVATGTVLGSPVVTVYDAASPVASSTFGVHDSGTRVSIYPLGVPMDGSGDEEHQSTVIVSIPSAVAKDLQLGTGKPWATIVRFEQFPSSWSEDGYVFARNVIEEEEVAYMRDEVGVSPEEFDVYAGDRIVRYGFVDSVDRATMEEMIRSFAFIRTQAEEDEALTESAIRVESPSSGEMVQSPLSVRGEARGSWYFEGSFPVQLLTEAGEVLAEVPATAIGNWMTEEYVPFEVSLVFASTTATSGTLLLLSHDVAETTEEVPQIQIPVRFSVE